MAAQLPRLVLKEPRFNQGFLVLDDKIPNVYGFKIFIYNRQFQANGTWNDVLIEQVKLLGRNYYRIPSNYFLETATHEFVYLVQAINANDDVVVSHGPISLIGEGTPWLVKELTICNGPTFAFGIQQTQHPSGGLYNYSLTSVYDYFDESIQFGGVVPFYEYIYNATWDNNSGNPDWRQYHELEAPDAPQVPGPTAEHNRVVEALPGGTYYNSDNELLSFSMDGIIGVQKTLGPWQNIGSSACYANGITTDWTQFGTNGLISHFNDYSNISEWVGNSDPSLYVADELYCPASAYSVSYDPSDQSWGGGCFEILSLEDIVENDEDSDGDVDLYDNQLTYADCMEYSLPGMEELIISAYDGLVPVEVLHFTSDDFEDAQGNFILPSFSIDEGFYAVTTYFSNGGYMSYHIEAKNPLRNTCPQSSLLDVTVFPVPLVGNTHQLHMVSNSSLNFQYDVLDLQATSYYSEKYRLSGAHDKNHRIDCDNLPSGILLHRFTFEDGSVKIIQSTH